MMPVENAAAAADMWNHQMPLRIVGIGGPEFVDRPHARADCTGGEFVPFEGTHATTLIVEREAGFSVTEKDDVAIAAGGGIAAPFCAGIADETAGFVQLADQSDCFVPLGLGDVEVVDRIADDVEAGDVAA